MAGITVSALGLCKAPSLTKPFIISTIISAVSFSFKSSNLIAGKAARVSKISANNPTFSKTHFY